MSSWNDAKAGSLQQLPASVAANLAKSLPQTKNGTALLAQQQQMLQLRQMRSKLGMHHFASTSAEILRKFAKVPASLSFHIYDTHYRFNNTQDSSIIPKLSPMAKSFLKHIIKEEIPTEMTELLKDFAIRFYDGCIILQVYDHRNMVSSKPGENGEPKPKDAPAPPTAVKNEKETPGSHKPKTYRTLLRPTPQSLYYDLLYHTDPTPTKFTDQLSLQMEAEVLTLTNRKLDLQAPLNPYLQDKILQPESEYPKKVWDEKTQDWKLVHSHLDETPREPRKLHQDQLVMHKSSEYEELMFLLSNHYKNPSESTSGKKLVVVGPAINTKSDAVSLEATPSAMSGNSSGGDKNKRSDKPSTIATAAAVLSGGNATSNQFMRLRFIEEIRKRKETQKAQAGAAVAAQTQNTLGTPATTDGQSALMTAQRLQQLKQQAQAKLMNAQILQQQLMGLLNQINQASPSAPQSQQTLQQQQMQNQMRGQAQLQQPTQQMQQGMSNMVGQNFQNQAQRMANMPRQNSPNANQQNLSQTPQQQQQQQQQMAKQASFMRQQQYQIQQARQQQIRQQQMGQAQNAVQNQVQNQIQNQNQNRLQKNPAPGQAQIPAAKRQKMGGGVMGQMPQQNQQFGQQMRTPQMNNSQTGSNSGTPVMANGMVGTPRMGNVGQTSPQMGQQLPMAQQAQSSVSLQQQRQQQQSQQQTQQMGQRATPQAGGQSGQSTNLPSLQQQQQQQIFQRMLSPQDQHTFRQLQARMNALAQIGTTGIAPNRSQITPQQQQQALQQAKNIQQQLLQKFPAYFQRLRQYQTLQNQRRQAMQQRQSQTQQLSVQNQQNMGNLDSSMYGQQNVNMNLTLPMMQQQMMGLPMMQQQRNNNMQQGQGNNLNR